MTNKFDCTCRHCPIHSNKDDTVIDIAESIRQWCRENSGGPFFDDVMRRSDVARYIERAEKTLRNHPDSYSFKTVIRAKRRHVPIIELAQWIVYEN